MNAARFKRPAWICALAAVVVYLPLLWSYGYCRDDEVQLHRSGPIARARFGELLTRNYWAGSEQSGNLYRPLTTASIAVEEMFFGGETTPSAGAPPRPKGVGLHHLVNVGLHAAAAVLGLALLALFGLQGRALLLAGLWLAVHPVRSDAVCEIVQRSEILAFLGLAGALLCERRWRDTGQRHWLAAMGGVFLAGLFAKESAATFLLALPLVHWLAPGDSKRPTWPSYAAAGGVFAVYLVVRVAVLGGLGTGEYVSPLDNYVAGAGIGARLPEAAAAAGTYTRLTLLPLTLMPDYATAATGQAGWGSFATWVGVLVGVAAATGLAQGRKRTTIALGCGWLAVTLGPFSNVIFPMGYLVAERVLYVPLLGVALLLGTAYTAGERRWKWLWAAGLVLCVLLGFRTFRRTIDWWSQDRLYVAAAENGSRSARVWFVVGVVKHQQNYTGAPDPAASEAALHQAVALWPAYASAWNSLGVQADLAGRTDEARGYFEKAVATAEAWDDRPFLNMGSFLAQHGDAAAGIPYFEAALRRRPDNPDTRRLLEQARRTAPR